MKTEARKWKRRTRQDIEDLLSRYHRSGKTVVEFSASEGVAEGSVYRWLRQEGVKPPCSKLLEVSSPSGMGGCITIVTPQGYRVEVPVYFSSEALKRLLVVLEG